MRKFLIIFLSSLFFLYLSFNLFGIYNYLVVALGNMSYEQKDYVSALSYYNKVISPGSKKSDDISSKVLEYNKKASEFYIKLKGISDIFTSLENKDIDEKNLTEMKNEYESVFKAFSNIPIAKNEQEIEKYRTALEGLKDEIDGNSAYLEFLKSKDTKDCKLITDKFNSAILKYSQYMISDSIGNKAGFESHMDYLKSKIKSLESLCKKQDDANNKKQDDKNDNENKDKTGSDKNEPGQDGKEGSENGNEEKKNDPNISGRNWTNKGAFNDFGTKPDESESGKYSSNEQKQQVENYAKDLKEFQDKNGKYLNRGYEKTQKDEFDNLMNKFATDPFFKDVIPGNQEGQKDW